MKHPHFDLIVQWANDPSIQIQMLYITDNWIDVANPNWVPEYKYRIKPHKHQELIDAFNQGKTIQYRYKDEKWVDLVAFDPPIDRLSSYYEYRIAPKTITKAYNIQYQPKDNWTGILNGQVENLKLTFEDTGERIAKLVKAEVIE